LQPEDGGLIQVFIKNPGQEVIEKTQPFPKHATHLAR
jgi:hypothetical protein